MGLTKEQQMPELGRLKKALQDAIRLLKEDVDEQQFHRSEIICVMIFTYEKIIKWIDQFFEDDPIPKKKIDVEAIIMGKKSTYCELCGVHINWWTRRYMAFGTENPCWAGITVCKNCRKAHGTQISPSKYKLVVARNSGDIHDTI